MSLRHVSAGEDICQRIICKYLKEMHSHITAWDRPTLEGLRHRFILVLQGNVPAELPSRSSYWLLFLSPFWCLIRWCPNTGRAEKGFYQPFTVHCQVHARTAEVSVILSTASENWQCYYRERRYCKSRTAEISLKHNSSSNALTLNICKTTKTT